MNLEFSRQTLVITTTQKFKKNPSSGSKAVARGKRDRQTDVMQLTVDFGNFAVAPKETNHSFLRLANLRTVAKPVTLRRIGFCFSLSSMKKLLIKLQTLMTTQFHVG